jgi:hypothetical protein
MRYNVAGQGGARGYTLCPKPYTLTPKPYTLTPKLYTLTPKPITLHPDSKIQTLHLDPETLNPSP